jgi:hypothetical protein
MLFTNPSFTNFGTVTLEEVSEWEAEGFQRQTAFSVESGTFGAVKAKS